MVIAAREDSTAIDPQRCKDVTLEAYRDAIDYLGFHREGLGSVTDGVGATTPFAKRLLGRRSGKVAGVRVNCARDRAAHGDVHLAALPVLKMHPLFNLECDDLLPILDMLGHDWVAKAGGSGATRGLENPMARLLFIRANQLYSEHVERTRMNRVQRSQKRQAGESIGTSPLVKGVTLWRSMKSACQEAK